MLGGLGQSDCISEATRPGIADEESRTAQLNLLAWVYTGCSSDHA